MLALAVASFLVCLVMVVCLQSPAPPQTPPPQESGQGEALRPQLPGGLDHAPQPQPTALPVGPDSGALYEQLFRPVENATPPNQELQIYDPDQVEIDGSRLRFTARRKQDGTYRSGQAVSVLGFQYGSLTVRVHSVEEEGLFPAVWMLPLADSLLPEVDIFEQIGRESDAFYGVTHFLTWPTPQAAPVQERDYFRWQFPGAAPESYTVRFDWTEDRMVWSLDGQVIAELTEYVPQEPMYLIMNLAVGGIWCGDPTPETRFPAEFTVEILDFQPETLYTR